ncbi:hypothetical protein LP316_01075 [Thalassotalea sp. LPB0316]|uniref:hypothetical protein n=1 Tax=Thalassotalea sp. LPB0316 TaxID=2769490 RepID=UPI0018661425|nr:hypothetical protein [Thalassotalea sp. LPB0316]QOL25939.1 hypothetical protein LP316_01075 [Thalassotalea sp. LPB0316]
MKRLIISLTAIFLSTTALAASTVQEGVIEQSNAISTKVGKDGKPLLGAAVGVGIGSQIGGGSGNDAAKVVGGVMGAKRAAAKQQKTMYGWRYIIKINNQLQAVDVWCDKPQSQCPGYAPGEEVYLINGSEVAAKAK